jgi:hypothetical protein
MVISGVPYSRDIGFVAWGDKDLPKPLITQIISLINVRNLKALF